MERQVTKKIEQWYTEKSRVALLVDGARQVGKTYIIHDFLEKKCENYVEINFLDLTKSQRALFSDITTTNDLVRVVSVVFKKDLVPGESVVFFDEVQECLNVVTIVKFLVKDGRFRYILSGSLLGVEMRDVTSLPVGYMSILHMYPMNFTEFCLANGVLQSAIDDLHGHFVSETEIEGFVHDTFLKFYRLYLIVGGMPAAVQEYVDTRSLNKVLSVQKDIREIYKADISKYDRKSKPLLSNIFTNIASELNSQNKRFKLCDISEHQKMRDTENAFFTLTDAGVAIPVYCADAPQYPLTFGKTRNLLKLFLCDIGLLASMYMDTVGDVHEKILSGEDTFNFGAIYENAVAQELTSNGLTPYYYNSKKNGELDLIIEMNGKVIPIEIKSGKSYFRHSALTHILEIDEYGIETAYFFTNKKDIGREGTKVYMPIYMSMFLRKPEPKEITYEIDPGPLNKKT
ncbi:MAG: AAA family ATPase [Clostridia bacterium]|nr:AAA family ATPase [Clostridia bacterium]